MNLQFIGLTDCIEKKQEASPSQKEDAEDESTAGVPESLSERPQVDTQTLASLPTGCLVSAAALTLISHTSHSLAASLTYLLASCVDIPFSLANTLGIHMQQTRTQDTLSTPTHYRRDNICKERGAETRGLFFPSSPAYQCSSGAVI